MQFIVYRFLFIVLPHCCIFGFLVLVINYLSYLVIFFHFCLFGFQTVVRYLFRLFFLFWLMMRQKWGWEGILLYISNLNKNKKKLLFNSRYNFIQKVISDNLTCVKGTQNFFSKYDESKQNFLYYLRTHFTNVSACNIWGIYSEIIIFFYVIDFRFRYSVSKRWQ